MKSGATNGDVWGGIRMDERYKPDVIEMKYSQSMCGVTRMDRWRNEEVWRRLSVREKISD